MPVDVLENKPKDLLSEQPDTQVQRGTTNKPGRALPRAALNTSEKLADQTLGVVEAGLSIGTGALAELSGGLHGLLAAIPMGMDAAEVVREKQDKFTYQPRTQTGQDLLETIASPLQALEYGIDVVSTTLSMGNPYAATAIKTTILGAPEVVGAKGVVGLGKRGKTRAQVKQDVATIKKNAERLNIDLTALNVRDRVAQAIREMAPVARGEGLPDIQRALRQLDDVEAAHVNSLYEQARQTPAYVRSGRIEDFNVNLIDKLKDYDISEMSNVTNRLNELGELPLDTLGRRNPNRRVLVEELMNIRRRANFNRPDTKKKRPERRATDILIKEIDNFLDHEFNQSMISGNAQAVLHWRDAHQANAHWRRNFSDTKVIAQLMSENASIRDMKNWIFGGNAVGQKQGVLATVRKLKDILGESSPQMEALRMEVLFDIAKPLLERDNIGGFISNYDKLVKENPDVFLELGLNVHRDLKPLRDFADTVQRVEPGRVRFPEMTTIASRFMFGHAIAQQGLKVNLAKSVMDMIWRSGETGRQALIVDMINRNGGYAITPNSLLIDPKSVAAGAVIADLAERELQQLEEQDSD